MSPRGAAVFWGACPPGCSVMQQVGGPQPRFRPLRYLVLGSVAVTRGKRALLAAFRLIKTEQLTQVLPCSFLSDRGPSLVAWAWVSWCLGCRFLLLGGAGMSGGKR